jgi:hypothetical protein
MLLEQNLTSADLHPLQHWFKQGEHSRVKLAENTMQVRQQLFLMMGIS